MISSKRRDIVHLATLKSTDCSIILRCHRIFNPEIKPNLCKFTKIKTKFAKEKTLSRNSRLYNPYLIIYLCKNKLIIPQGHLQTHREVRYEGKEF